MRGLLRLLSVPSPLSHTTFLSGRYKLQQVISGEAAFASACESAGSSDDDARNSPHARDADGDACPDAAAVRGAVAPSPSPPPRALSSRGPSAVGQASVAPRVGPAVGSAAGSAGAASGDCERKTTAGDGGLGATASAEFRRRRGKLGTQPTPIARRAFDDAEEVVERGGRGLQDGVGGDILLLDVPPRRALIRHERSEAQRHFE